MIVHLVRWPGEIVLMTPCDGSRRLPEELTQHTEGLITSCSTLLMSWLTLEGILSTYLDDTEDHYIHWMSVRIFKDRSRIEPRQRPFSFVNAFKITYNISTTLTFTRLSLNNTLHIFIIWIVNCSPFHYWFVGHCYFLWDVYLFCQKTHWGPWQETCVTFHVRLSLWYLWLVLALQSGLHFVVCGRNTWPLCPVDRFKN